MFAEREVCENSNLGVYFYWFACFSSLLSMIIIVNLHLSFWTIHEIKILLRVQYCLGMFSCLSLFVCCLLPIVDIRLSVSLASWCIELLMSIIFIVIHYKMWVIYPDWNCLRTAQVFYRLLEFWICLHLEIFKS